jgi:selenocysteine lyase/cysteine desulfurase
MTGGRKCGLRDAWGLRFDLDAGYLDTASIGVPPTSVAEALSGAVNRWRRGRDAPQDFDAAIAQARAGFADLIEVPVSRVAIGAAVSALVGLLAASIPDRSRVLIASGEFTSLSWPFAAQAGRGVVITEVSRDRLADRAHEHDVVAVSAVASADGALVDLAALAEATAGTNTRVLIDVTQAAGWLPLSLAWADAVVGASYKWLLAPRGAAWLALSDSWRAEVIPHHACWISGKDPWASIYGLPWSPAVDARALDGSPAWWAHLGAAEAFRATAGLNKAAVHAHVTALADTLRAALDMAPAHSAIVAVRRSGAAQALAHAGIRAASRDGATRLSFHLYNTDNDLDRATDALTRLHTQHTSPTSPPGSAPNWNERP